MSKLAKISGQEALSAKEAYVGRAVDRVEGRAKVTGSARYAAEFSAADLAYGFVINSAIAKGRILQIDASAALAFPGVCAVFTHENRPNLAWFNRSYRDEDAPPGEHFRPLYDDRILYSGQPVALVVAEDFETARYASSLIRVEYAPEEHETELSKVADRAWLPMRKKTGFKKPPKARGDAAKAYDAAPVRRRMQYRFAIEHNNPMETHAATVVWTGDGSIVVHDKTQGTINTHDFVCRVFGYSKSQVRVVSPYVGGAFGSGLRPQYQLFLAVMAARELQRSVRIVLSREQMFTFGYRPDALQTISLAAGRDGSLSSVRHEVVQNTSQFEDYEEVIVNWSGLLYHCPNVELDYAIARLDLYTPIDMRAPGAATGVNALEQALDELAHAAGIDPLELRLRNYAERDENENKDFTSKALRACYTEGARRFGWSARSPQPRSMRDGRELVGWGMATGVWEANQSKSSARAALSSNGHLELATAAADIGTGTYTILTQIGADCLGLPLASVSTKLGDSNLPEAPIEGGSMGAASFGTAVKAACEALREALAEQAIDMKESPLAGTSKDDLVFAGGEIRSKGDSSLRVSLAQVVQSSGKERMEAQVSASPSMTSFMRYARFAHSAIFVEVKVDEELGQVRVTRVVKAVAAGRILNPKTARSQVLGGVVWGISKALHEESMLDHRFGRFMNHNYAEYHIPVHADIHDIEVIFVDEHDEEVNPLGVKGVGEIGVVGTAAAVANAVFHATGKRIYELPIRLDKLLDREPQELSGLR
jgi:xanthine dehydrogenase YagR molybdenum-binding subunit